MTTLNIKYGKLLSVVKNTNGINSVFTEKVSNLHKVINNVDNFSVVLSISKVKKTEKIIKALGFSVEIDYDYGFEFECKMYCNLIY